jgi:hypothetical protein
MKRSVAAPIPVTVLTGFLGSGKTTLLRRLLAQPEARSTSVLINEIGEIGLDHLLGRAGIRVEGWMRLLHFAPILSKGWSTWSSTNRGPSTA